MLKLKQIFKNIKWTAATLSVCTMVASPVAMGAQVQKKTTEELKKNIQTLGLNKKMTFGEFYKKNKTVFPARIQKQIEGFLPRLKNTSMPTIEVVSTRTTSGENIPTLRLNAGKELINLQWYGEPDKLVKFQNTNLSNIDLINFNDMFVRVLAGDERYRKPFEPKPAPNRMYKKFQYPDVTKAEWKSMSAQSRASYIINMRNVWQQAREVLRIQESLKAKKTSQFQQKNPLFFKLFFGAPVEAVGRALTANSCIVAGYVSEYEVTPQGEVCSVEKARTNYASDELFSIANRACAQGQIACNPYIYGARNGQPTCLTPSRTDANFQRATHFDGPCDQASRLQSASTEVSFLRSSDPNMRRGRYSAENLREGLANVGALSAEFEADHRANRQLTEDYILGVLKLRDPSITSTQFSEVVLTDDMLLKVKEIRDTFNQQIERARRACSDVSNNDSDVTFERNYWQACDQLHRRFLFVDVVLQERCQAGGLTYNAETLKCSCAAPAVAVAAQPPPPPPAEAIPGAACPARVNAAQPPPATPASADNTRVTTNAEVCDENPIAGCVCPNGQPPSTRGAITSPSSGAVAGLTCAATTNGRPQEERNCNFLCQIGRGAGSAFNFIVDAAPYLLTAGVALYALHALSPEKPRLQAPADTCPSGTPPPCLVTCTPPQGQLPGGGCGCPACPIGQTANAGCLCVTTGTGGTGTRQLCPDDVTYVENLATCPKYPCGNTLIDDPRDCVLPPPATTISPAPAGTTN